VEEKGARFEEESGEEEVESELREEGGAE
jgi:hypothetical protein